MLYVKKKKIGLRHSTSYMSSKELKGDESYIKMEILNYGSHGR